MTRCPPRSNVARMKNWTQNPGRLFEKLTEDQVQSAAQAIRKAVSLPVLKALVLGWGVFLVMIFTLLFTVRIALTLPLYGIGW